MLIQDLNGYGLELREGLTAAALESLLAEKFNTMILKDFSGLVQFLYRMDISETRLEHLLKQSAGEEAGRIMARFVIERQFQKIETRRKYAQPPDLSRGETGEEW